MKSMRAMKLKSTQPNKNFKIRCQKFAKKNGMTYKDAAELYWHDYIGWGQRRF